MDGGELDSAAQLDLEVVLPSGQHVQYVLDAGATPCFVLGRTSEVRADDPLVSRAHAMVLFEPGSGWRVKDLDSMNGTYLNGTRVTAPFCIKSGDVIRVGKTAITVARLPNRGEGLPNTQRIRVPEMPPMSARECMLDIEIDEAEKERDVDEIVKSTAFQALKSKATALRECFGPRRAEPSN